MTDAGMGNVREQFGRALAAAGEKYADLVVVSPEMKYPARVNYFADAFPERYIDVGIAEQNAMTVAAGLAACGKRAVLCGYADFVFLRSGEQIRLDVAYNGFNVTIFQLCSGVTFGVGGSSHQTFEDIAAMRAIAGLTVVVPADARAGAVCVDAALAWDGPIFARLGRDDEHMVYRDECPFEIGRANVLRQGGDAAILACGSMVYEGLVAAELLATEGIAARVVDMHTIKPIDADAVRDAAKTGAIITVEEHSVIGGLGSAVLEVLDGEYRCPVRRIGFPDVFPIVAKTFDIRGHYGLSGESVAQAARELLKRKL